MRATLIGVQGAELEVVLAALELEPMPGAPTGDWVDCDYSCRTFPGGWIVVTSQLNLDLATDLKLAASTTDQMAVGCEMYSIPMHSYAQGYRNGQLEWSVTHDPDDEARPLAVEGTPPAIVAELGAKAVKAQADEDGVDFAFDVPMQLVAHYTGFVYDEDEATDWVRLRATAARLDRPEKPQRRFWRPLFLIGLLVLAVWLWRTIL
ncbi:hypothetical protein [Phenylobacterium sp.]|uniref:hypothetical protein n=1 Tax=Phenylobacterium sp. TaxID=1871053 RepID=UPI00262B2021|nr:hypothetical protein [Phenylobacterium sp.]